MSYVVFILGAGVSTMPARCLIGITFPQSMGWTFLWAKGKNRRIPSCKKAGFMLLYEDLTLPVVTSSRPQTLTRHGGQAVHSIETLNVLGYHNEVVACTFFRQEQDTHHVAVLFPGFGYTGEMPLLYYPRRLLVESGADALLIGYNYSQRPDFLSAPAEERDLWLRADTTAAYKPALAQRNYERVTLLGKSIGTRAIGHLLATEEPQPSLKCVWLTPIVRNELLRAKIKQRPHRALFVVGTADPHYDPARLDEVQQATAGQAMIIEHVDHSLEIQGEIVRSIHVLEGIMAQIERFLG